MSSEDSIPAEGAPAPDFDLAADDGTRLRLADLRGKRVILFFYPRADTPGCTKEACEFRDRHDDFTAADTVVLGISPDGVDDIRAFREKFSFPYTLLADPDHEVAERYGVWQEKTNYGRTYWGVVRTTFVIDEKGQIKRVYRRVKPEGHAAAVLAAL